MASEDKNQLEEEIVRLKMEVKELTAKRDAEDAEQYITGLIKTIIEEREKTNRMLTGIMDKVRVLEHKINSVKEIPQEYAAQRAYNSEGREEMPLSGIDVKIIGFVQTKDLVCADDVKSFMNYKGKNAACARLNMLCKYGFLNRYQMGHKVYYRFDAGKATKKLIISPPQ
ncbi:MAG: hypothetical protein KGI00_02220 [Candidatus Micrarchaeota archaeon]|nr:hypothetical protein [Candidatus Micrarchaeota archaeon]MDE1849524.1 hypothetical protein [Candidatus Micrarchaeota archaeon]